MGQQTAEPKDGERPKELPADAKRIVREWQGRVTEVRNSDVIASGAELEDGRTGETETVVCLEVPEAESLKGIRRGTAVRMTVYEARSDDGCGLERTNIRFG